MTTITIGILMGCLAFSWYTILKKQERLNKNFETETRLEKELLRTNCKNDVLSEENRHLTNLCKKLEKQREENHKKIRQLCTREDELIEQWAQDNCEREIELRKIFAPHFDHKKKYKIFEIDGIEIKNHMGTASEMWELYNDRSKEVYTKREDAKVVLKGRIEEVLADEEVTDDSLEVE